SLCPPFSHPPARSFLHSVRASALPRTALLLRRPSALLRMLHGRRLRCGHRLIDPVAARPYKPPPAGWPAAAYRASRRAVTRVTRGAYKAPPRYTRDQLAQEALPPETLRPASGAPTGGGAARATCGSQAASAVMILTRVDRRISEAVGHGFVVLVGHQLGVSVARGVAARQ